MVKAGVEEALEEAGAVDGDEIRIAGRSFYFESAVRRDPEVEFIEDDFRDVVEQPTESAADPEDAAEEDV